MAAVDPRVAAKAAAFCLCKKAMDALVIISEANCGGISEGLPRRPLPPLKPAAGSSAGEPTIVRIASTPGEGAAPFPTSSTGATAAARSNASATAAGSSVSSGAQAERILEAAAASMIRNASSAAAAISNASAVGSNASLSATDTASATAAARSNAAASPTVRPSPVINPETNQSKLISDIEGKIVEYKGQQKPSSDEELKEVEELINKINDFDKKKRYTAEVQQIKNSSDESNEYLRRINDTSKSGTLRSIRTNLDNRKNLIRLLPSHYEFLSGRIDNKIGEAKATTSGKGKSAEKKPSVNLSSVGSGTTSGSKSASKATPVERALSGIKVAAAPTAPRIAGVPAAGVQQLKRQLKRQETRTGQPRGGGRRTNRKTQKRR